MVREIVERLTRYGNIDVMWFDGGPEVISIEESRFATPGRREGSPERFRLNGAPNWTT